MIRKFILSVTTLSVLGLSGAAAPARATERLEMTKTTLYKVMYKKGTSRWREEGGYSLYDANRRADVLRAQGYTVFVQRD